MDVDHLEVPEEIITTVTNPKKRIKQKINSSQSNELVILPPTETHSCHTSPMLEGDVNIIPLCLSSCGSRVWARRRDNYDLLYCNLDEDTPTWEDSKCGSNVGAYGLTRSGAAQERLALQILQTGAVIITNGVRCDMNLRVCLSENGPIVVKPIDVKNALPVAAIKALEPVYTIGLVAVVEKVGLVFISSKDCFQPKDTIKVLKSSALSDTETGTTMEATLSVKNHLVGVVEGSTVLLINMADGSIQNSMNIPGMVDGDRVWQISLGLSNICVCSTHGVHWLCSKDSVWHGSPANAALCCVVEDTHQIMAMVTAVGDVVFVDTQCRRSPVRLKQGSVIEPFASMHTRNGIAAWGGLYVKKLRLLKAGGAVHEVTLE